MCAATPGPCYDSNRLHGFELRADDIIISTPAKCGTTWTQMICALLVFQKDDSTPLDLLSPWLDMQTRDRNDVFADLAAQTHRRFIKTHTPLRRPAPRTTASPTSASGAIHVDVARSWDNHMANMDIGAFLKAREQAAAIDGIELDQLRATAAAPRQASGTASGSGSTTRRPSTQVGVVAAACHRRAPLRRSATPPTISNVVLLHYDDLKADLDGQMRKLAARLGIDVEEAPVAPPGPSGDVRVDAQQGRQDRPRRWPRSNWIDPAAFFSHGTSGQWRDLLDNADLGRYAARVRSPCVRRPRRLGAPRGDRLRPHLGGLTHPEGRPRG